MKNRFSIIIPTYKQASVISETLDCLAKQTFANFEVIICIDGVDENYIHVSNKYNDKRFKWFFNNDNLGFCGNINRAIDKSSGEIIFFLGSDDIISNKTLEIYDDFFDKNPNLKVIARTYYAFDENVKKPIRVKDKLDKDLEIIKVSDDPKKIKLVFSTLDQFSNLAFYKNEMKLKPSNDVFTSHAYTIVEIFVRTGYLGYVSSDLLAVRVSHSQCRTVSTIYDKSPILSWIEFLNYFFKDKYSNIELYNFLKDFWITKNYVGLFQIANFSRKKYFFTIREIYYLVKFNYKNIFIPHFWIISIMCLLIPKLFLIKIVDFVKIKMNKYFISKRSII